MQRITTTIAFTLALIVSGCVTFQPHPISPAETSTMLQARTLADTSLESFMEKNLKQKFSSWPPGTWNFDMLTLAALYFNPDIRIARAEYKLSEAGVTTAKEIPNPAISLIPEYVTNPGALSPWAPAAALAIPIETAGKIGYRSKTAVEIQHATFYRLLQEAWLIRSGVRAALLKYSVEEQRYRFLTQERDARDKYLQLVYARYQNGEASDQDYNFAATLDYETRLAFASAAAERAKAEVGLAGAIGITTEQLKAAFAEDNPLTGISLGFLKDVPDTSQVIRKKLQQEALTRRPDILAALSMYEAAESNLQLQIARQYPNIDIGPGYQWNQGRNQWSVGISLTLPIFNQNQGSIAEAEAQRQLAEARLIKVQADAINQIESAASQYLVAYTNYLHADSLAAAADQVLKSEMAKFRVGESDKLQEYDAHISALQAALEKLTALETAQTQLGLMEDAVMTPFQHDEIDPAIGEGVNSKISRRYSEEKSK